MPTRKAEAVWEGNLLHGHGIVKLHGNVIHGGVGNYAFATRMENQPGTNPEELIAAAHAGCFSMALAALLSKAGHTPKRIHTMAEVHLDKVDGDFAITRIVLHADGVVPGCSDDEFRQTAELAKDNCPVSRALLGGTKIEMEAKAFV